MKNKKPKIVILRGKPTAGKSTAIHNLKKEKFLSSWTFIDFPFIKDKMYSNLNNKERYDLAKKSLCAIIKVVMKSNKNIILEEVSEKFLKKKISYHIKKNNYEIITFQFEVSKKEAYKRDVQRGKEKWHPSMGKKWIDKMHEYHKKKFDKNAILIDCDKLDKKQIVKFIIKNLK